MDTRESRKARVRERQRRSRAKRESVEFCPTKRALAKLDRILQGAEAQLLEMSRAARSSTVSSSDTGVACKQQHDRLVTAMDVTGNPNQRFQRKQ